MKEFIVKTKLSEVKFNFPTKLEELSIDYLKSVTDNVIVAPNYSLIGLVYHERLTSLIMTCKNKSKKTNIGVNPIFIKSGGGDASIVDNAKIRQRILVDNTQIQLAHHCATPANRLTLDYFASVINNTTDKELYEKASKDPEQHEVFFVEFKIIANCNIMALYDDVKKIDNPYITVYPTTDNEQKQ